MQRGVLILSKIELKEIVKYVSWEKFDIALENIEEINKISVNEEDLENILDQLGMEGYNELLNSTRVKIAELLRSFR